EFLKRRKIRIVVIEMHDEADRDEIVVVMIEKRAAAGLVVQRPAQRMLNQALLVLRWIDLPDLLQADPEFRRLAARVEAEFRDELLGEAAARAFRKQRVLAAELHAAGERGLQRVVLGNAQVAGGDAPHRALVVVQDFGGGKARIDLDTERLRLAREPAA